MKTIFMNPVTKLAASFVLGALPIVLPIVNSKVSTKRKEKKRLKDGNIFILKPKS